MHQHPPLQERIGFPLLANENLLLMTWFPIIFRMVCMSLKDYYMEGLLQLS
jgi:hypothetical protein